jgi:ACS family glucarate transporter-like MFS transporter
MVEMSKTKMTNYRWFVLVLIFIIYTVANADRVNLGVALPYIIKEFGLSNTEAGGIVSLLFMAYAVAQIPGGYIYTRTGVRRVLPFFMILTSMFTWLQGVT